MGAMQKLAASDHPFDQWFNARSKEIRRVDFNQPPPGPPVLATLLIRPPGTWSHHHTQFYGEGTM